MLEKQVELFRCVATSGMSVTLRMWLKGYSRQSALRLGQNFLTLCGRDPLQPSNSGRKSPTKTPETARVARNSQGLGCWRKLHTATVDPILSLPWFFASSLPVQWFYVPVLVFLTACTEAHLLKLNP